ncbi:VCBS repeat-containing protein [Patescibacteria group bacterium]|nr:VCBS repeat-containing protein [Patescibacteria group bacterium]
MIKKAIILLAIIGLCIPIGASNAEPETGWYGQYFNYSESHSDMSIPVAEWPDNGHGDPLGDWDTDWYSTSYLRYDKIDESLTFNRNFFPFDVAVVKEENNLGHDRNFGVHWQAYVTTDYPGNYNFSVNSDDDTWIYLDGKLVVDNSGIHAVTAKSGTVMITKSQHTVDIFYADRNAYEAYMAFNFSDEENLTITPTETPSMPLESDQPEPIVIPPSLIEIDSKPTGVVVATSKWEEPYVKVFDRQGNFLREFLAYEKEFLGGINLAVADITLDGKVEIIVGPAEGRKPEIRLFNIEGKQINSFMAYDENFGGGVNVAIGDVDGDGTMEIITGAGVGGHLVKVFTYHNGTYHLLSNEFSAYNYNYLLGVKVAVGDLDGDGKSEIITGTESGGGPHVRVFDGNGNLKFSPGFFAYREDLRHGIKVAAGDLDGDGRDEIITGTNTRMGPHVRVFDPFGNIKFTPGFFAYNEGFRGGVNVAVADLDLDGRDEIITGAGPGGGPHVRIFNRYGQTQINSGFFAFPDEYRSGVQVGGGIIE